MGLMSLRAILASLDRTEMKRRKYLSRAGAIYKTHSRKKSFSTQLNATCMETIQRMKRYRKVLALKRVTRFATVVAAANAAVMVDCLVRILCPFLSILWSFFR